VPVARARRLLAVLAALFTVAVSVTACVSMPSAGPVQSYPVTQGTEAQNQLYGGQFQPQPPGDNWSPAQIVQGFLTASASFGAYSYIAKEYLTPQGRQTWNPFWSAIVYKSGPYVKDLVFTSPKKDKATMQIAGKPQAYLVGTPGGSFTVPSASAPDQAAIPTPTFSLVKLNGQWRIQDAPKQLLLTTDSFQNDYQLSKLYFFDPAGKILVPDPVYVPLQAGGPRGLVTGLVNDLISPPKDWLSYGATRTAFPPGTKILGVTIDGVTAVVSLGGTIARTSKASLTEVMQQVSSQLLFTLTGAAQSGQAVKSVEVVLNGKSWVPPRAQGSPFQQIANSRYHPANGPSTPVFYAVDKAGYVTSRASTHARPVPLVHIGTGFQQIAVSPSGKYLAALRDDGVLYTAALGDPLVRRGAGYLAMSWDNSDQLWASTRTQLFMIRGPLNPQQPLGQPVPVQVNDLFRLATGPPYTSIRVAPDGVRVALISDGDAVRFGAIAVTSQEGQRGGQVSITITLSQVEDLPVSGLFTGLTWYGPDDVITLTDAPAVTEYPVSGAPYTAIPADTDLSSITAGYGQPLIASLPGGRIVENVSLEGAWMPIDGGYGPTYPG
jgi:lipoprotein LpqB-like beta-propeller protein/sporulation and spore germination protein